MRFVGLEDRLSLVWISSAEAQKYVRAITEFTDKIRRMGPSPLNADFGLFAEHRATVSQEVVTPAKAGVQFP